MKKIAEVHVEVTAREWPSEDTCEAIGEVLDGIDWVSIIKERLKDAGIDLTGITIQEASY